MVDPLEPLGSLAPDVRQRFAAMGPVWGRDINAHRDFVIAAYTPLVASASRAAISVQRDIPYGAHARQVLDVYTPEGATDADVVVFVHGGAFVRGSKSSNGAIYDNVCWWFARQGMVAVNIEYRLAADAPYPGGAQDVGLAVRWLVDNVAQHGGNAARLFLVGHSAGGAHVATYAFDPASPVPPAAEVSGVVIISGRLRADVLSGNPNAAGVRAYFGDDPALYEARSPVTHAARSTVPLFIAIAEFENPYLDIYGAEFYHRVALARGNAPRFRRMQLHNHTSIVAHFDSGEESLGRDIVDFIVRGR
jgi:acetyl esterase/lipase